MPHLLLILGDQLNRDLAALTAADPTDTIILMAEVMDEASYVRHHKKKIALIFSAMRHHAAWLREQGWQVDYVHLDDAGNSGSLVGELDRALTRYSITHVTLTEPGEWRLTAEFAAWQTRTTVPNTIRPDTRFIASHAEFATWADGRKSLRMEYFYRDMRRKTGLLMHGSEPEGGQWNYDADNRKPASADLFMPRPLRHAPDGITQDVLTLVRDQFAEHFGSLEDFWFAVTPDQAEASFRHFLRVALPHFGDFQDAMLRGEAFLYHAAISPALNCGLLDPLAMCRSAEAEYHAGRAPLNAVEGFIRQIIGWREYVRGIYWREGPDYAGRNALDAHRPLPAFYWSADTRMACVRAAVEQTRDEAYAHHIQRLMITGTFALLAGIDPHELHQWYLAVYADAYEWVELPNTLGMSQYGDGGLLASKPYAASGAYIDRMSDYCENCAYSVSAKTGAKACPFNLLYWDFIARHANRFGKHPRMAQMVRTWQRMDDRKQAIIRHEAAALLDRIDQL